MKVVQPFLQRREAAFFWMVAFFVYSTFRQWVALEQWLPDMTEQSQNPRGKWLPEERECRAPTAYHGRPLSPSGRVNSSVAFLFLTKDERDTGPMETMWQKWLPSPNDGRYHLYVHTAPSNTTLPLGPFFCQHAIPSVKSRMFFLLQAQLQLLKYAMRDSANHFVFMSLSHLPLRSFNDVYEHIISLSQNGSKSLFPMAAEGQAAGHWELHHKELGVSPKHFAKSSQWIVLNREHAQLILKHEDMLLRWDAVMLREYLLEHKIGAPDELFFPTLLKQELGENFNDAIVDDREWVYVEWWEDSPLCSKKHKGPPEHPCTFLQLRTTDLERMQEGPHYFMRKIKHRTQVTYPDGTSQYLVDAVPKIIKNFEAKTTTKR